MSNIPDFASASYPEIKAGAPATASGTETWMTNEQIPVPEAVAGAPALMSG